MIRKFKIINVEFLIIHSLKNTVKNPQTYKGGSVSLAVVGWLSALLRLSAEEGEQNQTAGAVLPAAQMRLRNNTERRMTVMKPHCCFWPTQSHPDEPFRCVLSHKGKKNLKRRHIAYTFFSKYRSLKIYIYTYNI